MSRRLRWFAAVALIVVIAIGWLWLGHAIHAPKVERSVDASALKDPALIAKGQYLVIAGDCAGCHTAQGGRPYAGGVVLPTPFGNIASPNLTPDHATGLGDWSFDDFWQALHSGKGRKGELLYPVFSYTSYTKVTRDDALAMFAYLQSLPPTQEPRLPSGFSFPYDIRSGLAAWRALYFHEGIYQPDPGKSAQWNRGAYLVQGLGHCNECHAARDSFGGSADQPLTGGQIPAQNWYAPDLSTKINGGLQGWSEQDIVDLLKTGQSGKGSAFGPMADVVYLSTQHLSDDDLRAIANYLSTLPPRPKPIAATGAFDSKTLAEQGSAIYADRCAACHGKNGQGVGGIYPPLDGNSSVNEPTGINATRVVLLGGFSPNTQGNPRPYSMPPFAQQLNDAEVAAVVTYIRQAWSNHASALMERDVSQYRHTPID